MQQLREMDFKELVAALKQHGRGGIPRQPKVHCALVSCQLQKHALPEAKAFKTGACQHKLLTISV